MNLNAWQWQPKEKAIRSGELLKQLTAKLQPVDPAPMQLALFILSACAGKEKPWLLAHAEAELADDVVAIAVKMAAACAAGNPLPYLLGEWAFYGRPFTVTPQVLIPRPETELLVESALTCLKTSQHAQIADIGTGSGCIAISLAKHLPNAHITAVDVSFSALRVAQANITRHACQRQVSLLCADLLAAVKSHFDLIIANLPYIPTAILKNLAVRKTEPILALDGGKDGLKWIKPLLLQANNRLSPQGIILLEIEETCGAAALNLAKQIFPHACISLKQDYAKLDRIIEIKAGIQDNATNKNPIH